MPERYNIQRQNISPFTITQFGLTTFVRSPERANAYVALPYNFYLCPPAFGRIDPRFSCQASSLQFLRRYKFDFNKVRRTGDRRAVVKHREQTELFADLCAMNCK